MLFAENGERGEKLKGCVIMIQGRSAPGRLLGRVPLSQVSAAVFTDPTGTHWQTFLQIFPKRFDS